MNSDIIKNEEDLDKWFKKNYKKLGYTKIVKDNNGAFPDYIMLRDKKEVRVELEVHSSNFKIHKHDVRKADEIVCLKHTANYNPPLRIIEINRFIKEGPRVKAPFIEFFDDKPAIRLWDYLLTERELDFSITDMAENAGIGRATLYRIWESLISNEIIIHTRDIGKAKLYKLNTKSEKIKKLIEIYDMIILEDLKKRSEHQKIKITA